MAILLIDNLILTIRNICIWHILRIVLKQFYFTKNAIILCKTYDTV